ncbi:MAG TPA: hypothetical protein IAA44_02775 [Candidatus Blautia avistercoris]|nr:hypothetical protein [Blautia sp. An249]HIY18306.1 hypothetical protein [Candidatus Blautia avistercoris]
MKEEKKLVFQFHNPNTDEDTIRILMQVFCEKNRSKAEKYLQERGRRQ